MSLAFLPNVLVIVFQFQKIAFHYFGSLPSRQVEPLSALHFLSPILSSLASSPSKGRIAFASKLLRHLYVSVTNQLVPSAMLSDRNVEARNAWIKNHNPLSAFAMVVFALIEKYPKLSSEELLRMLAFACQSRSLPPEHYSLASMAALIVRERLSVYTDTANMVSLAPRA